MCDSSRVFVLFTHVKPSNIVNIYISDFSYLFLCLNFPLELLFKFTRLNFSEVILVFVFYLITKPVLLFRHLLKPNKEGAWGDNEEN